MLDENWTELTSKDVDTQAFLRRIETMKSGGTTSCPFCGGTVRMIVNEKGKNVYACDSCDMRIETDTGFTRT